MLHLLYFVLKFCTYENKSHLVLIIIKQSNMVTYRTPKEAVLRKQGFVYKSADSTVDCCQVTLFYYNLV